MLETLIRILEHQTGLTDWKIKETNQSGEELFFIGKNIDMTRSIEVVKYEVTFYKDFDYDGKKFKGSSTIMIHPTMTETEIDKACKNGIFNSQYVKNIYYPIVDPTMITSKKKSDSGFSKSISIESILKEIYGINPELIPFINSVEIFSNLEKKTIINSKGLHLTYTKPKIYIEMITNAKGLTEEIELYEEFTFSTFSEGDISKLVSDMTLNTLNRAKASYTPNLRTSNVILSGSSVVGFLEYYLSKSSAKSFYEKTTTYVPGDSVQGKEVKADKITLWLDPELIGSYYSCPFDNDGFPLQKLKIIDNSSLIRYWGDIRFSHYVEAVPPTGSVLNFQVEAGNHQVEEMKKEPYLEVVSFSDFQMDSITGDFGGEIRLGFYFDGNKTIPVTKGSIVGNILDAQKNIILSKETQKLKNFIGPKSLLLHDIMVAGI